MTGKSVRRFEHPEQVISDWFTYGRKAMVRDPDLTWDADVETVLATIIGECEGGCSLTELRDQVFGTLFTMGYRPELINDWLDDRIDGAWMRYRKDGPNGRPS